MFYCFREHFYSKQSRFLLSHASEKFMLCYTRFCFVHAYAPSTTDTIRKGRTHTPTHTRCARRLTHLFSIIIGSTPQKLPHSAYYMLCKHECDAIVSEFNFAVKLAHTHTQTHVPARVQDVCDGYKFSYTNY